MTSHQNQYAMVYWTVEDVQSLAEQEGVTISEEEAHAVLESAERNIKDLMTERGWEALNYEFQNRADSSS